MTEVIDARFKPGGKQYSFNPNGLTIRPGQGVILSTTRGEEYGECTQGNHMVDETTLTAPLRPVLRLATEQDIRRRSEQARREKEAMRVCQEKIQAHGLEMKLVSCEYALDGSKILFFFTAENRVDFRALVKDLAAALHSRIELRQIGVRDETKLLGGLGICGQPYCCSRFLERFQPVSIKMAKTQSLSLNPTKISGACGRLMCCLKYEQEAYEDAVRRCPKRESFVETPDGAGTIAAVDYLRETVKVRLEDAPETPQTYQADELNVIRSGKGRRPEGYVAPPREELEKLRKSTPAPVTAGASDLTSSIAAVLGESEPERPRRQRNNRRGGDKAQKPQTPKSQQTPKAQPEAKAPEGREGQARPGGNNRRRRHRGGGKGKSPGGQTQG